ncbi:2,4-dichlorophenol 6-monooxygenase, partial [Prauserella sp. PE36]|uniref:FAD-dependent monooxygenase n=1 Tax=Prauserella sp. PE36 TaxID=1504709 RepID=UPI000DE1BEFA
MTALHTDVDLTGDPAYDTDVVVVGLGPAGGTAAAALATYGIRVHAVTRYPWVANGPRAHITNQRAAEVLRDLGLEEVAKSRAVPWDQMGTKPWVTSLTGEEIARLELWGTGDRRHGDYLQNSPCGLFDLIQPLMEPVLIDAAGSRGAILGFNTEYLRHTQDADGVTVTLRDRRTGHEFDQRAKYLLGFDGANSAIAAELGLEIVGETARAGTVYTRFDADLSHYVAHRPTTLYSVFSAKAGFGEIGTGLLRAIRPWDQWIMGYGFDMAAGEPDMSPEFLTEQIRALVGDPDLEPEIVNVSLWYVNQQHATSMGRGRVWCGGDATHRHPPSSGLGSNTSIQDAFNIAWKVAYAVRGDAGQSLLDSYSDERVPVGEQIVARANQSREEYAPLREWLVKEVEDPVAAGLERLNAPTPEGIRLRDQLHQAVELKNTEFNAEGIELNQRYVSSAVLPDPTVGDEVWERDPTLYAQATTRPGAKLPHAWLIDRGGRKISTLDVVGKGRMTVVTGLAGVAWEAAVEQLGRPWLRSVVIGRPG